MEITMDELIVRFRRLQDGHRVDSGYNRGVSDCIRVLLEIGENEGCECGCDRQQEVGNADLQPLAVINAGWKPETKEVKAVTKLMEITVMRDALNICFNGEFEFERIIKYCPMCGRELKKNDCT